MDALVRRGHARLIPALILHHDDERVLARALAIFGASARKDWFTLAARLLDHPSEALRLEAARALARHGRLDVARVLGAPSPRLAGYAALHRALAEGAPDLAAHPSVAPLLAPEQQEAQLGLLMAIADLPPQGPLSTLLHRLARLRPADDGAAATELLARAIARHPDPQMIPLLVDRLAVRAAREPVRQALLSIGKPALEAVWAALGDPTREHRLRIHLPNTLGRFGGNDAGDRLLRIIESDRDGRIRYKALRALGRLAGRGVRVSRPRAERLAVLTLDEHLRLRALRAAFDGPGAPDTTAGHLLMGLLDDKLRQALDRTFRLLAIAHPHEDLHRAYVAARSTDPFARANAVELVSALLFRRDQGRLRQLVVEALDDRAPDVPGPSLDQVLPELAADPDVTLSTLAALARPAGGTELAVG
jgi:hypothetical protein